MNRRSKVIELEEAAALIPDSAVVTISASSGLGCPDALLRAVGKRFAACGHPRGITSIHPIAAGDMYGIDGIDHLARQGLLRRVIAGSLPSGPSRLPSPRIWKMIHDNEVEAYNLPSGILYHMHRESAAGRPGILTKVGMDTFVDPALQGGRMNECSLEALVTRVQFDGDEWLFFRSIPVDVALIRGTTADEHGNISTEHEGGYLGIYDQALAARCNNGLVVAQVKRIAQAGTIPPQNVRVPGVVVDHVVVAPDQMQTTETLYEPAISGEIRPPLGRFNPPPWSPAKCIARRAAMELRRGEAVNLGFGISALVPQVLIEEGQLGGVTWVIEQGAVGGIPLMDFQFGCAAGTDAIVSSPDQFTYFQGGGFDSSLLSFLEIDIEGNVNVSRLSALPHVTAGVGGFMDITAGAKRIVFIGHFTAGGLRLRVGDGRLYIDKEGSVQKLVKQVEHVTFSGRRARQLGQDITYVTDRCVLRLDDQGLIVTEIAPGVNLQRNILDQTRLPLRVSETLRVTDVSLYRPAPFGLKI